MDRAILNKYVTTGAHSPVDIKQLCNKAVDDGDDQADTEMSLYVQPVRLVNGSVKSDLSQ